VNVLLDEGVPRTSVSHLRDRGHIAEHVLDLGLAGSADEDVLAAAVSRGSIVVTLDSDFHRLLASARAKSPSVVRVRIEGLDAAAMALLIASVIERLQAELESGAAISVTPRSIRVRRLPLT